MRPKRPWLTAFFSICSVGLRRFCLTTKSRTLARRRRAPCPGLPCQRWPWASRSSRGSPRGRRRCTGADAGRWGGEHHAVGAGGCQHGREVGVAARASLGNGSLQRGGSVSQTSTSSASSASFLMDSKWFWRCGRSRRVQSGPCGPGWGMGGLHGRKTFKLSGAARRRWGVGGPAQGPRRRRDPARSPRWRRCCAWAWICASGTRAGSMTCTWSAFTAFIDASKLVLTSDQGRYRVSGT